MLNNRGEYILQEQYGTRKRAQAFYENQMLDFLNDNMRDFLSKQTMMFISTSDADGNCDSSFRGGTPGFVRSINPHRIIYPEYKGNGVMASLGNILENPHIGLMFIDFFEHKIGLHINGRATIVENGALSILQLPENIVKDLEAEGDKAERWVVVDVEEAYIHCSKHIPLLRTSNQSNYGTSGDFFQVKPKNHAETR
jgi:uncharacterized protein